METGSKQGKGLVELYLPVLLGALQLLDNGEARRTHKDHAIWQRMGTDKRPEMKTVQAALHLFYCRIKGRAAAKKDLRGCWPITEGSQQKEFKALMHAWVRELAGSGRLPPQTAKFFVTGYQTWGVRTVELLFHLALLAMEAELARAYPEALTTVAPGLQDAHPSAFDLALAEERHRQGVEQRRLRELLAALQQVQQLLVASAGSVADGSSAAGLLPWWSMSQAHADRVVAIQQVAPGLCDAAAAAQLGVLDALLRPNAAAVGQDAKPAAMAGFGMGSSEANPAGIGMIMGMRLAPPAQPASRQGTPADCAAIQSRLAVAQLHLGAAVLEIEQELKRQQQTAAWRQQADGGTPVLQLLPPSPPRANPVMDALRSAAASSGSAGPPSPWGVGHSGSTSCAAVEEVRQGVWAAVRGQEAHEVVQSAHGHAGSASAAPPLSPVLALTPLPLLRLRVEAEQHSGSHTPVGSAGGSGHGGSASSQPWGSRLQSGASALPSPTLSQMLESSKGGMFLLSPADNGRDSAASSGGWGGAAGGFSLPPSLPLTPRWGSASPGQPPDGSGQQEPSAGGPSTQALQPQGQQGQQPDSPCSAESIASFSVLAGGAASAAVAQGLSRTAGATAGRDASSLRPAREPASPAASSAAASVVPAAVGLGPQRSSATSSHGPAQLRPASIEAGPAAGPTEGVVLVRIQGAEAAQQQTFGAQEEGAATPESKVHSCYNGWPDAGTPCSQGAAGRAAGPGSPPLVEGLEAVPSWRRTTAAAQPAAFSPPRPISDSPPLLPLASMSPAAGGAGPVQPSLGPAPRRSALVVTTSSPTKTRRALPVAMSLEMVEEMPAAVARDSPHASECSQGTRSMYSPPKALASPTGSIFSRGQVALQDASNSGPGAAAVNSGPAKDDISGLMQRFAKLRVQAQKQ